MRYVVHSGNKPQNCIIETAQPNYVDAILDCVLSALLDSDHVVINRIVPTWEPEPSNTYLGPLHGDRNGAEL